MATVRPKSPAPKACGVQNTGRTLPGEWIRKLDTLARRFPLNSGSPRIAVFDLDNTLLIHDVGDAVFAYLRSRSLAGQLREIASPLPLSWTEYSHLIRSGLKEEAYRRVACAMSGLEIRTIRDATRRVMTLNNETLEVDGFRVPTPRPEPRMTALLRYLEKINFKIRVISASHQESVRIVAAEFLGLDPEGAWGVQSATRTGSRGVPELTSDIIDPFPHGSGKVDLYHLHIGVGPPMISAGDSESDIPLLNLTCAGGMIIWRGAAELLQRAASPFRTPEIVVPFPS